MNKSLAGELPQRNDCTYCAQRQKDARLFYLSGWGILITVVFLFGVSVGDFSGPTGPTRLLLIAVSMVVMLIAFSLGRMAKNGGKSSWLAEHDQEHQRLEQRERSNS